MNLNIFCISIKRNLDLQIYNHYYQILAKINLNFIYRQRKTHEFIPNFTFSNKVEISIAISQKTRPIAPEHYYIPKERAGKLNLWKLGFQLCFIPLFKITVNYQKVNCLSTLSSPHWIIHTYMCNIYMYACYQFRIWLWMFSCKFLILLVKKGALLGENGFNGTAHVVFKEERFNANKREWSADYNSSRCWQWSRSFLCLHDF